jgi:hypothetical protein
MVAAVLYREDGELGTAIPNVAGVYATDRPPFFETDAGGRQGITFRAFPEWAQRTAEHPIGIPVDEWPGWHRVDFDPQRALVAFLSVEDAAAAMTFAAHYGPLWACTQHPFPCLWRSIPKGLWETDCDWVNAEPVDWWLRMAAQMRSVVAAAQRYKEGHELRVQDWQAMGYQPPDKPYGRGEGLLISAAINGELQRYGVHVGLRWDLEAMELAPGLGFVPALWQQLASTLASGHPLALCSGCGTAYIRRRRAPKRNQRNYCATCRARSVPQRLARRSTLA